MGNVIIRLADMPCFVRGQVIEDEEGDYNIYINENLSWEMQEEALRHEMCHVERQDFCGEFCIEDIERVN